MYQLLIVDDERSVVDSLALTISWEDYGIEEVHCAYSAEEALEIANKHAIDVLVTDIRMPETDGLELIERIRRFSRKIRCIILSGHDEFEYAQKAIQYGTMSYLLKPVDIEELIRAVRSGIQDIEREWLEISSHRRLQQTLHANLPMLRNQLLNDLLRNRPLRSDVLEERLSILGLDFRSGGPYRMMVVRLEEDFSGYDLKSLSLLEYAVSNIAEEVLQDLYEVWHGATEQGYLVFLLRSRVEDGMALADSYAVKFQNHVQKFLKGSLTICLSGIGEFPNGLSETYLSSISSIQRNAGRHHSYFISTEDALAPVNDRRRISLLEPPLLPSLLEEGNWAEALAKVRRMLFRNEADAEPTPDHLLTVLLYLSSAFSLAFSAEDGTVEEQLGEEFDLLLRKKSHLSRQRILDWAESRIGAIRAKASDGMEDAHRQIASKVRAFIQGNLAAGISLQLVADHVGLHPVYLSKVYKTITGETIGDYLYRTRMERAAYLLRDTELKIAEISSQLGFLAPPHFIKIFKKHHGCTPQEFRNRQN
ncbi:response regulator [Cohnella thailandensis]|uniref:Response regulator n=1 Tax=Cohnella thailandensis TaxID=557557 RepID=A0A841SXS0_9BACL|nr:response regulator [Cohnella thailandensis]MBB6634630.1 response regulator [Cohnella thailandensis]MBP1972814.1 two-component system response regulator YesN [Cohnella thailandensis]